jgi:nucleoside-diphosphate-sugar epimerase
MGPRRLGRACACAPHAHPHARAPHPWPPHPTPQPPKQEDEFCDEFHLVDLRLFDNCRKVVDGCDHAFHMAADMGGMGFIQSNHSVILYNNTMISYNFLEACRQAKVQR